MSAVTATADFYADPFAAMNSVAGSSEPLGESLPSGGTTVFDMVEQVDPGAAFAWKQYDLKQGMFDAQAAPMQTGFDAMQQGEGAMRQWARFQLGVVKGAPLSFEVQLFQGGGFARGLENRWNTLVQGMAGMPQEARKAYEKILNEEFGQAMQLAMLQDQALGEYTPMDVKVFSADGQGGTRRIELSDATIAKAKAQQEQDARLQQEQARAEQSAASDLQLFGMDGDNPMRFAQARLARMDAAWRTEAARPPVEFRIDVDSINLYQSAKFEKAVDYAQQFDPVARGGIVAIAMGTDWANLWLAGELGFHEGQEYQGLDDGKASPNTRALAGRWERLSGTTLMAMPEFLREKYEPLANQVMQRGVYATMHLDRKAGLYEDVVLRDFTRSGPGEEFRYFLTDDGGLGREAVRKDDGNCIDQILLPIINVALYFVPVVGPALGAAMTVATSIKNGVETGNWLGATVGAVAGLAGLGGAVGGLMGAASGAASGTLGSVTSALNTVANVGRIAGGVYGLATGIETGNIAGAIGGGLGIVGGLAKFGSNDAFAKVDSNVQSATYNPSIIPQDIQTAVGFANDGLGVYQAVEGDNAAGIAAGLTGFLSDAADLYGNANIAAGATYLDLAANFANGAVGGDQAAMSKATALGLGFWYGREALQEYTQGDRDGAKRDAKTADQYRSAAETIGWTTDATKNVGLFRVGQWLTN